MPKLGLGDLLRRRKMTLAYFIKESGVSSYGALVGRCEGLGVQPPPERDYLALFPVPATSQQDGVIVLDPIPVIDEITGREIDPDAPVTVPGIEVITAAPVQVEPEQQKKIRRKKRDEPSDPPQQVE